MANAVADRLGDSLGLLEDLLEHEGLEARFLGAFVVPVELDLVVGDRVPVAVDEAGRRGVGMVVTLAVRGGSVHEAVKSRGFINVPARLDPKRFTAAEQVYDDAIRAEFASLPRYFTWSDIDVV